MTKDKTKKIINSLKYTLLIVLIIIGFQVYMYQVIEHESTCEKCTITGIKNIERSWGSSSVIYETTCGDKILGSLYYEVGDKICK